MPQSSKVIEVEHSVRAGSVSGQAPAELTATTARRLRTAAMQFVLIGMAALAYFGVRGLTEASEATAIANAGRVLNLEAAFGIDVEASLQGVVLGHRGLVTAAGDRPHAGLALHAASGLVHVTQERYVHLGRYRSSDLHLVPCRSPAAHANGFRRHGHRIIEFLPNPPAAFTDQ